MKSAAAIFLLCFINSLSFAQNIDSLLAEISKSNDPEKKFELWTYAAMGYQTQRNDSGFQLALVQMLQNAMESKNDTLIFNSYFFLGGYYENKADFNHSLENHFKALRVAEKGKMNAGICLANEQAAVVYKQLGNSELALYHLKIAETYLSDSTVISSVPWVERAVYANTAEIYLQLNKPDSALIYALLADNVVDKKNDLFGYTQLLGILGTIYSKLDKDSMAQFYFKKGIAISDSTAQDISLVSTLNGYSSFLLKRGEIQEAKKYGLESLNEHRKRFDKYGTLSIEIADVLAKIYSATQQYDSAYYYATWRDSQKDSVFNEQKLAAINDLTFSEKIKGTEEKMKQQEYEIRQKQIQMYFLLAGLLLLAVVAYVSYRSFVNKKRDALIIEKEKERSDKLLLNILPAETAEELKSTGTAEAKSFDEVTVMFTDFKNFTQASEKMSAKELVREINYIFSEFDKIISKHNIEKIKTIGDSYMCAGGLPVANKTNATDVISASLEIQKFMKQLKEERQQESKHSFEIRIGCHTGPVVAGIVGIKKFAYDIWGDTVNIASRMESSGEQGKVNISGTTHELVKEKFSCTYRGKIQAKNKGEIDMYFVEAGG
ncbi:MAG: adenylate/guanylate cyclase domain-containing protein [Chitinophagales bacterium]|nr:adenylate/guanylate cyclase domain-containing protein [Chitinophagales bacterium]